MSFHRWYAKSIEEAQERNTREATIALEKEKIREALAEWERLERIAEEKRMMASKYNNDEDLWGI